MCVDLKKMYINTNEHRCMYMNEAICSYIYVCVCVCVCVRARNHILRVCVSVCVHVCVCVCLCVCVCVHTRAPPAVFVQKGGKTL
jgi:hypothetical protein